MRRFKQLCAAGVLTLAITMSAFAGEMETGITAPQPSGTPLSTTQGETETTGRITATDSVVGIALTLVQSVLALV